MDIEGFIIRLAKTRRHGGMVRSEFTYSEEHDCHIYQGRVIPIEEFNSLVPGVIDKYKAYESKAPYPVLIPKRYPNLEKARATLKKQQRRRKNEAD